MQLTLGVFAAGNLEELLNVFDLLRLCEKEREKRIRQLGGFGGYKDMIHSSIHFIHPFIHCWYRSSYAIIIIMNYMESREKDGWIESCWSFVDVLTIAVRLAEEED